MIIKSKLKSYKVTFKKKLNLSFLNLKSNIFIIDKNVYKKFLIKKFNLKNVILVDANEKLKDFINLSELIDKLIKKKVSRQNQIVAIGGGTVQDASSFISSIIFRGIKWIYIPTTIIGQCDSCIGGKTSINYKGVKNQIGNFYPADQIIIFNKFLEKISGDELASGIGEMAHFYFVHGKEKLEYFFKHYVSVLNGDFRHLENLIKNTIQIKKHFIEKDEFDKGKRLLLNYGHSFGHAIEKYFKSKIYHGIAVAHGMDISNYISFKLNYMTEKQYLKSHNKLKKIFKRKLRNININKYFKILQQDKKNTSGNVTLILSNKPGKMFIFSTHNKSKMKIHLNNYFNK